MERSLVAALVVSVLVFASLPVVSQGINNNRDPFANAGPDITVAEDTAIFLDGSGSFDLDPDDQDLIYSWSINKVLPKPDLDGDGATDNWAVFLTGATTVNPCFITPYLAADQPRSFEITFELFVDDGNPPQADPNPDHDFDTVKVTVMNTNQAPHGEGNKKDTDCDEPFVLPPLRATITTEDNDPLSVVTELDIIEDRDNAIWVFVRAIDDKEPLSGQAFAEHEVQDVIVSWPLPRTGNKFVIGGGEWDQQVQYGFFGGLPMLTPDVIVGVYDIRTDVFDGEGGKATNTEQDLELEITCERCGQFGFDVVVPGAELLDSPEPVDCFPDDGLTPQETMFAPVPIGPTGQLRIDAFFPNLGTGDPDAGLEDLVPYDLLLWKIEYKVCIKSPGGVSITPDAVLPRPHRLDLGSLPEGAAEIMFNVWHRDPEQGNISLVVPVTPDVSAPDVLVVHPDPTYQSIVFPMRVYVHDDLDVRMHLRVLERDGEYSFSEAQQTSDQPGPLLVPDLAGALRRNIPTPEVQGEVPVKFEFGSTLDYIFDEDGDGTYDGYFDVERNLVTKFLKGKDCNADGTKDLVIDVQKNGKACDPTDIVIFLRPCAPNLPDPFLVDANKNGKCDTKSKKETELLMWVEEAPGEPNGKFLVGAKGREDLNAFLADGASQVFTYFVDRPFLGNATWLLNGRDSLDNGMTLEGELTTLPAHADTALLALRLEGREPRWGNLTEDGTFLSDDEFEDFFDDGDRLVALLPGDRVRLNATVIHKEAGAIPNLDLPLTILIGDPAQEMVPCDNPNAFFPWIFVKPGEIGRACDSAIYAPGVHKVKASIEPIEGLVEDDPSDQNATVTFEVYLGKVEYTPPRAEEPREFYIRADKNGLPRLTDGVIELAADTSYDMEEADIEIDGKLRSVFAFTIRESTTKRGETTVRDVEVYWDPLARYDVANEEPCGKDPAPAKPVTCRPITQIAGTTAKPDEVESPGLGVLALLGALAVALARRYRTR